MFDIFNLARQDKTNMLSDVIRLIFVLIIIHVLHSTVSKYENLFDSKFLATVIFWVLATIIYYLTINKLIVTPSCPVQTQEKN